MGLDMIDTLLTRYMKMNTEHITKMHDRFTQQPAVEDVRQLSARLAAWRDLRRKLKNSGQTPTEEIQLGSLLKVMAKLPSDGIDYRDEAVLNYWRQQEKIHRRVSVHLYHLLVCHPDILLAAYHVRSKQVLGEVSIS